MRVENFTVHNMGVPHKPEILELKKKHNRPKPSRIEHNQEAE